MKETEVLEEYEGWDPDEESISDLVERLEISRQRLYAVLSRHRVVPKTKRAAGLRAIEGLDSGIIQEMAEMALGYLVNELHEARSELAEYSKRFGSLD